MKMSHNSDEMTTSQKLFGGALISLLVLALIIAFATGGSPPKTGLNSSVGPPTGSVARGDGLTMKSPGVAASSGGVRLAVEQPVLASIDSSAAPATDGAQDMFSHGADKAVAISSEDIAKADKLLTEKDNGQTIRVAVGQTVAIRLKENRTTGYGWQLEQKNDPSKQGVNAAPKHLEVLEDKSMKSPTSRHLVGAPGQHVWLFRATTHGTSPIYLTYRRPWLPASTTDPAQTYEVTIEVTEVKTA